MKALRFHASKDLRVEDVDGPKGCGPHVQVSERCGQDFFLTLRIWTLHKERNARDL
jgi:hypothetical protein